MASRPGLRLRRLYHLCLAALLLAACTPPQVTQGLITVSVSVDGQTAQVPLPAGSTVDHLLQAAQVALNPLDRTDPPLYTVLTEGARVTVIRVTEEFTVEQVTIPFQQQTLRNESLPEGETRLIQPGVNGLQEITTRHVYEDGVEVASAPVKTVVLQDPSPEIVMVGSQAPFAPVNLPGRLAYLSAGNAWVMEGSSGSRRPVITSGDLDGRVFRLSPDGAWLLFTRRSPAEETINTLWAAKIDSPETLEIDLQTANVIHFADWAPASTLRVAFSTVEPRAAPPGWQANNDLRLVSFSTTGWVDKPDSPLDANSGGIYGWWGASFVFAPGGLTLAYTRPDSIGVFDLRLPDAGLQALINLVPYNTQSEWAWVPGAAWSPQGETLFTVVHPSAPGDPAPETSPLFDLAALPLGRAPLTLVPQVGMFAQPAVSPATALASGEQAYEVAYLQAIFPAQSDTSRYRLSVIDRDGSNRRTLFPPEGAPGLNPQQVVWSPQPLPGADGYWIAVIYEGNLWLVNPLQGDTRQLTGDGLVDRLDWR